MKTPIESIPSRSPNPENLGTEFKDDWKQTEIVCPDCELLIWQAPWWDDLPENGGACIGTHYRCGNCGYSDFV
jgi:DNA-directed RNA polymerase subunit RPC12/RpoP